MNLELLGHEKIIDLQRGGLSLIVNDEMFSFGTDAVLLADFAKVKSNARVADLGAGTGILSFLVGARTIDTSFAAIEIQKGMCEMMQKSIKLNGWESRMQVHQMDMADAPKQLGFEVFDSVVVNPPYYKLGEGTLPANQTQALSCFELACTLESVVDTSYRLLKNAGLMYTVLRTHRFAEFIVLTESRNLGIKSIRFVHSKVDKEAKLVLIECAKNKKCELRCRPPLILSDKDNHFSEELNRIYYE